MSKITVHYNTGNLKDPELPPWVIYYKGQTYYCDKWVATCIAMSDYNPERERVKARVTFYGKLDCYDLVSDNHYKNVAITGEGYGIYDPASEVEHCGGG